MYGWMDDIGRCWMSLVDVGSLVDVSSVIYFVSLVIYFVSSVTYFVSPVIYFVYRDRWIDG